MTFGLMALVSLTLLVVKAVALADAAMRPADAYLAADKLNKRGWLIILGLAVGADLLDGVLTGGFGILGFIGIIAALVYLVDVRPAVRALRR